ncbi:MAG: DUF167 family protein [Gammaproteobacteria bacterium]
MTARWDGKDLLLAVYIQPRASRDEITGQHGEALRIRVAAPPVDGEANAALCRFLADVFGVAKSAVSVESGQSGRRKTVRIREPRVLPTGIAIPPR